LTLLAIILKTKNERQTKNTQPHSRHFCILGSDLNLYFTAIKLRNVTSGEICHLLVENIRNLVRKSQRKRYVLIIGISRRIILALTLSIREGKRSDQESPAAEILMTVTAV
jgi:hypothetical protein